MKMFVISIQFNFLLRTFCVSGAKKIVMMNKRIFTVSKSHNVLANGSEVYLLFTFYTVQFLFYFILFLFFFLPPLFFNFILFLNFT